VRPRQICLCMYDTPPHGLTSVRTPAAEIHHGL
jgi:hypothetical protein